jgi:hypothetical protein
MQIPIKFDRFVRPEWIDFALETLCSTDFDANKTRQALRNHLDGQVEGKVALSKTITQIMRIVGTSGAWTQTELRDFREQMSKLAPSQRTELHLRLLRANPFFNEFCATLSRLAELGTTQMSLGPVKQRMDALYGDRPIVRQSLFSGFRTLQWMGVVEQVGREWKVARPEQLRSSSTR